MSGPKVSKAGVTKLGLEETLEYHLEIRDKILHLLKIYPIISPTMLQGGLGPQIKPVDWRPVLAMLIEQDDVLETTISTKTPFGRFNTYTKLSLPGTVITSQADET